jgi:hypothetical protein
MPLPKDPESRAKIAKTVVALMRLKPEARKRVLDNERARRAKIREAEARTGNQPDPEPQ